MRILNTRADLFGMGSNNFLFSNNGALFKKLLMALLIRNSIPRCRILEINMESLLALLIIRLSPVTKEPSGRRRLAGGKNFVKSFVNKRLVGRFLKPTESFSFGVALIKLDIFYLRALGVSKVKDQLSYLKNPGKYLLPSYILLIKID